MLSHGQLINKIAELKHYHTNESGMCAGIALMGAQAVLAEDVESLSRRLKLLKKIPDGALVQAIEQARARQQSLHKEARAHVQESWLKKLITFDNKVSFEKNLNKAQTVEYYDQLSKTLLSFDELLTQEDRDLLVMEAYFQGIVIHYSPDKFPEIFEKNQILNQSVELTLPKALSKKLVHNETPAITDVWSWAGAYSKVELNDYFSLLAKYLIKYDLKSPVVFFLESGNHGIIVSWEPNIKAWRMIDANQLDLLDTPLKESHAVANAVRTAFTSTDSVTFETKAFSRSENQQLLSACLRDIKSDPSWRCMHTVNEHKAKICDSFGTGFLFISAKSGNVEQVDRLIRAGANVKQIGPNGCTALYIAVQHNHLALVEKLLALGADVNAAISSNSTPLLLASKQGSEEIVKLLLSAKADPNVRTHDGDVNALIFAAQGGFTEIVDKLVKSSANVNHVASNNLTAIFLASQFGYTDIVKLLTNEHANPNIAIKNGSTALIIAAQNGYIDIVKLLLEDKAKVDAQLNSGSTALYLAAQNGHTEIVKMLLAADANVDLANNQGVTPLYMASQNGDAEIVKLLIAKGANVNLTIPDGRGPLFIAVKNNRADIVQQLLAAKADPEKVTKTGLSPLLSAVVDGRSEIIKLLLEAGADTTRKYVIEGAPSITNVFVWVNQFCSPSIIEMFKPYELKETVSVMRSSAPKKDNFVPASPRLFAQSSLDLLSKCMDESKTDAKINKRSLKFA